MTATLLLAQTISTPTLMLMGGVLLVSGILLFQSNRYFARQSKTRSLSETLHDGKPRVSPRPTLPLAGEAWEVQMQELARELSARLDSKMGALEQLVLQADRAAARLERATADARDELRRETDAAAVRQLSPAAEAGLSQPTDQPQGLRSPRGIDVSELGETSPSATGKSPGGTAGYQQRYEEIYMLADYGYPAEEIAQRVGTPIGEVQLILGLRKKR